MPNLWFKFYGGEYLSDPKIERMKPIERSCWITLLCLASMTDDGVIEFLTVESLLNKSGIQFDPYHPDEWENALSVLQKFQTMKMIELGEDGFIKIINWNKRQEHNLTVAERVAKHRAKNKGKKENVTTNVTNVTTEKNRIEKNREENVTTNVTNVTTEKNRIEKNREERVHTDAKVIKKEFGELGKVLLSEEEYGKLIGRFGEKNTNMLIFELDTYIASSGKKYSSHYATLLNWAKRKWQEIEDKKITGKNKVAFS